MVSLRFSKVFIRNDRLSQVFQRLPLEMIGVPKVFKRFLALLIDFFLSNYIKNKRNAPGELLSIL